MGSVYYSVFGPLFPLLCGVPGILSLLATKSCLNFSALTANCIPLSHSTISFPWFVILFCRRSSEQFDISSPLMETAQRIRVSSLCFSILSRCQLMRAVPWTRLSLRMKTVMQLLSRHVSAVRAIRKPTNHSKPRIMTTRSSPIHFRRAESMRWPKSAVCCRPVTLLTLETSDSPRAAQTVWLWLFVNYLRVFFSELVTICCCSHWGWCDWKLSILM